MCMKNRTLPFGYGYENALVVEHPTESKVLQQIFQDYLDGDSLLTIANRLNALKVEYMPGVIGWNKARIMRIIEDTRYLGGNGYPALVDEATHIETQTRKSQKNKAKELDREMDIFKLAVPVICPKCGSKMTRRHDSRLKCPQRWTCKNDECRTLVEIEDGSLLSQITGLLNQVILHPEILRDMTAPSTEQPIEIRKLENEIGRILNSSNIDTDSLKKKMMECLSLKYRNIPSERNTAKRLRADFESSSLLAVFSSDLTNKTVAAIHLKEKGTVEIVLRNGQTIRKE